MTQDVQVMLSEIEALPEPSLAQTQAHWVAGLELRAGNPPNLAYAHNVLAAALGKPLQVKHD